MTDLDQFRRDVRAWLETNCPPEMRKPLASDEDTFWGGRNTKFSSEPVRYGPTLVAHPLEPYALRLGGEFGVAATPERIFI